MAPCLSEDFRKMSGVSQILTVIGILLELYALVFSAASISDTKPCTFTDIEESTGLEKTAWVCCALPEGCTCETSESDFECNGSDDHCDTFGYWFFIFVFINTGLDTIMDSIKVIFATRKSFLQFEIFADIVVGIVVLAIGARQLAIGSGCVDVGNSPNVLAILLGDMFSNLCTLHVNMYELGWLTLNSESSAGKHKCTDFVWYFNKTKRVLSEKRVEKLQEVVDTVQDVVG